MKSGKTIVLHGGHSTLYEVEPAVKTYLGLARRALQSFQNFDTSPEQN